MLNLVNVWRFYLENLKLDTQSITYNQNQPVSACIPYVVYDPDCSIDIPLDRGQGSVIMIKTLLQYIHRQIPSIKEISFEDKSNIECATEYEIQKKGSRVRKKGTHVYPSPLYYFSIAFNGETWYEKYFNARQKDRNKHDKYRAKIDNLLYSEELKTNTSFLRFLEIAQPPVELIDELEHYYNKSGTFKDFFQSIPKSERCKQCSPSARGAKRPRPQDAFMSAIQKDVQNLHCSKCSQIKILVIFLLL